MLVNTSCKHPFVPPKSWAAGNIVNCTVDCPTCNMLLIIISEGEPGQFYATDFHQHMHDENPEWPADGVGTGMVSF